LLGLLSFRIRFNWGGLLPAPGTYQHDARDHGQETGDGPEVLACHEAAGKDANTLKEPHDSKKHKQDPENTQCGFHLL
jgi:hypothetical protein